MRRGLSGGKKPSLPHPGRPSSSVTLSSVWVNRAAYTNATVMIRIRIIPGVSVEENMEIGTHLGRFLIDSVEVIAGKYVQILAHNKASEGSRSWAYEASLRISRCFSR